MLVGVQDALGQAQQEITRLNEQVTKHVRASLHWVISCDLQSLWNLFLDR